MDKGISYHVYSGWYKLSVTDEPTNCKNIRANSWHNGIVKCEQASETTSYNKVESIAKTSLSWRGLLMSKSDDGMMGIFHFLPGNHETLLYRSHFIRAERTMWKSLRIIMPFLLWIWVMLISAYHLHHITIPSMPHPDRSDFGQIPYNGLIPIVKTSNDLSGCSWHEICGSHLGFVNSRLSFTTRWAEFNFHSRVSCPNSQSWCLRNRQLTK